MDENTLKKRIKESLNKDENQWEESQKNTIRMLIQERTGSLAYRSNENQNILINEKNTMNWVKFRYGLSLLFVLSGIIILLILKFNFLK